MLDSLPGATSCIGSGHCQSMTNCGYCSPPGSDLCKVCGCDGVTYESIQAACVAGVSTPLTGRGECGVSQGLDGGAFTISCRSSAQCPANADCCQLTGRCFDRSQPWRCEPRPDGGLYNCANSSECNYGPGSGGGSGSEQSYCAGDGCSEGPGTCHRPFSVSQCSGVVDNVCGCNGFTYVNECWARAEGARIASNGACP